MVLLILGFLISLIPSVLIYLWFKKLTGAPERGIARDAFLSGLLSTVFVVLTSFVLAVFKAVTGMEKISPYLAIVFHNFFVLAFSEEIVKLNMSFRVMKKYREGLSMLEVIIVMGTVGIAFGLMEDIPYAFESNIIQMLVRGLGVAHGVYGMITGYFYAKGMKTGKPWYKVLGFLLVWLMHGLYDLTLKEEILALSDLVVFIPVLLALLEFILLIVFLFFLRKASKNPAYTEPLPIEEAK